MTAADLAALHAAAFTMPRPWSAAEIAGLLADPAVFLVVMDQGFALGRCVLDEAELLTIAVHPAAQGQGIGMALFAEFLTQAATRGAGRAFLEVAETNAPARSLYTRAGFAVVGCRRGYFRAADGKTVDAIVMARDLPVS